MKRKDYFDESAIGDGLSRKAVRGGAWTAGAQLVCIGISLSAQPALARLLDPADFGLVAMVTVFTNFGALFLGGGFATATIQQERITAQQVSNLFWVGAAMGLTIATLLAAAAPFVAWLNGEPRLVAITMSLTVVYLLSCLRIQHQALLERTMRFREVSIARVLAAACGQAAAVSWAWNHRDQPDDYWALVLVPIVTTLVMLVSVWWMCGWWPSLPSRGAGTRPLLAFGVNLTGSTMVNYFSRNADKLLLGWHSGTTALGYYERAYGLLLFPIHRVNTPLTMVVVPALSRLKNDPARLSRAYVRVLRMLLLTTIPLLTAIACTSESWVVTVLGGAWRPAAPILGWLAVAGAVQPVSASAAWLYLAQGRADALLRLTLVLTPITLLAFLVGLPWGGVGVAACYALTVVLIRFPMQLVWLRRYELVDMGMLRTELLTAAPVIATVAAACLALASSGWIDPSPAAETAVARALIGLQSVTAPWSALLTKAFLALMSGPPRGVLLSVALTATVIGAWCFTTSRGRLLVDDLRWAREAFSRRGAKPNA